ncbi:MAG TPA: fibronectin type III domain-containing protein, partial [Candidatus Goldiibacteriota bacterium]|nr:fibronectin type III domain-containing protein [Candidatus Goldiibacteriota bacterium]
NTAGLIQLDRSELDIFLGPLLNMKEIYTYISFGSPFFADTAWQLSVISLIHNDKNMTKEFTVLGSFASTLNLEKTFSVGVNVKYLNYNSTATYQINPPTGPTLHGIANGLGLDIGLLYQIPLPAWGKKFNLGLFIQDIDTQLQWEGGLTDERVPTSFRFGGSYYLEDDLLITSDLEFFADLNIAGRPISQVLYDADGNTVSSLPPEELRVHVGVEGWFFKRHLGMRGGYTAFATMPGRFTGGVSYREDSWQVDYAYVGHAEHLGDSHRVSVIFKFGQERKNVRAISVVRPPKNLQSYPANNAVNLTWEPNDDPNVTGYAVYMSNSPGTRYIPVAKRVKENYVTVDGLKNGTRYYFVVTAINNTYPAVESAYSNETSVSPAPVVPGTPEIFPIAKKQTVEKNGAIPVKWGKKPPANMAGYNIYMSDTTGKGYQKVNPSPVNDIGYTVKGL